VNVGLLHVELYTGRDQWKKRYYEEKKKGAPMEESCNKMRQELMQLQRRIRNQLETTLSNGTLPDGGLIDRVSNLSVALLSIFIYLIYLEFI